MELISQIIIILGIPAGIVAYYLGRCVGEIRKELKDGTI